MVAPMIDGVHVKDYILNLFQHDVDFLEDDPDFRCVRKNFHVVNAAKALVLAECVGLLLSFLFLFPWCILWIVPHTLLILCTIYALKKEKHRFLWPILGFSLLQFVVWCLVTAFSFTIAIFSTSSFLGFFGQDHHEEFWDRAIAIVFVKAGILTLAGLFFWRFLVFRSTQQYFQRKMDGEPVATELLPTPQPPPSQKLMTGV